MSEMTPSGITLSLTLPQTNLILEALGQLPYVRSYELIAAIHEQAQRQLAPPAGPAEPRNVVNLVTGGAA